MKPETYVVITPVRNEEMYLQHTIDSMAAQTVRPALWIIVDDGSTDATPDIVNRAMQQHSWIRLHRRPDRGVRKVGGGVIEAFNEGLHLINLDEYEYVCKLDGDLQFAPQCFERLMEIFRSDPELGTASGKCWDRTPTGWAMLRTSDEFSLGACKFYRIACFREIGGFVDEVMWDGIDCHRCRMLGWTCRSLQEDVLRLYELRPMGSSYKSVFHGRFRWGWGQYFMGTHWLYALAIAAYRMFDRPFILGGLCILAGYVAAALRRVKRYDDPAFRRHLRRWQLARLMGSRPSSKPV